MDSFRRFFNSNSSLNNLEQKARSAESTAKTFCRNSNKSTDSESIHGSVKSPKQAFKRPPKREKRPKATLRKQPSGKKGSEVYWPERLTVYCAGFSKSLSESQIKEILSVNFGAVKSVYLNREKDGVSSRGSGFAVFQSVSAAHRALDCRLEYIDGYRMILLPFKGKTKSDSGLAKVSADIPIPSAPSTLRKEVEVSQQLPTCRTEMGQTPSTPKRNKWGCREQNHTSANLYFHLQSHKSHLFLPNESSLSDGS